jgi:hypothetical protein
MPKGEAPVAYIVALLLAVIIIAVIAYMFFTKTGLFAQGADMATCKAKQAAFCFEWSRYQYDTTKKPAGGWDEYQPGCTEVGVPEPSQQDCQLA